MPLYEYECSACKHRFELLQKFSDKPAKICVRCGGPVIRLLSSPSIQFKGTGWYVTDYGTKSSVGASTKKEKKGNGAGEKPSAASAETKPSKEPSSTSTEKSAKS